MKLHLANDQGQNRFTGYGEGYVAVNNQRYDHALVVTPTALHEDWQIASVAALDAAAAIYLINLAPEILLLGTGARQSFPATAVLREFARAQIGVETMDTAAACRTYNILMAEGRNVVAAIIV